MLVNRVSVLNAEAKLQLAVGPTVGVECPAIYLPNRGGVIPYTKVRRIRNKKKGQSYRNKQMREYLSLGRISAVPDGFEALQNQQSANKAVTPERRAVKDDQKELAA